MMGGEHAGPGRRDVARLLLPLLRGWRVVMAVLLVTWVGLVIWGVLVGHRYRAEAHLSTVSTTRSLPVNPALAAALLGSAAGGGVQLTPALLVRIARMDEVLYGLGTQVPAQGAGRLVDRLVRKPVRDAGIVRAMRRFVTARYELQTGVITVAVSHRDSALARAALHLLVDEVSVAYRNAARGQAREIREAQQVRVDSARSRLTAAEQALTEFLSRNRIVNEYTAEHVQLQAFEREIETANTMYTQALTDRDAALGKELEETPAVVMVGGPPAVLPVEARGLGVRLVLATILLFGVTWGLLVAVDALRRAIDDPTPAAAESWQVAVRIPVVGRVVRRMLRPARPGS